jgi:hypothetical protein
VLSDEQLLKYTEEEHECPYCKSKMDCCHAPEYTLGDGLGWCSDIFHVCLNDNCKLYKNSWYDFRKNYGKCGSCRFMILPGEKSGLPMLVLSCDAFKDSVVDKELLLKKMNEKKESDVSKMIQHFFDNNDKKGLEIYINSLVKGV